MKQNPVSKSPWFRHLQTLSPTHIAAAAWGGLLLFGALYRVRMLAAFASTPSPFFSFQEQGVLSFAGGLWNDLTFATWSAAGVWLAIWAMRALPSLWIRKGAAVAGWLGLHLYLMVVGIAYGSHLRVMFEMQSGLTFDLVMEARSALTFQGFSTAMSAWDTVYILLPWVCFWACLALGSMQFQAKVWLRRGSIAFVGLIVTLELFQSASTKHPLHQAVRMTPLQFLASDYVRLRMASAAIQEPDTTPALPSPPSPRGADTSSQRKMVTPAVQPTATEPLFDPAFPQPTLQTQAMRLFEPLFTVPHFYPKDLLTKGPKKQWNVVLLLLESLGTRYMFDTSHGNRVPMAFMKKLLPQGWFYRWHFSTANSSPRSLFSIFTGLYPIPQFDMFVMRKDTYLPTIPSFLPPHYESFFVTPGGLFWYFPKDFFLNNGPKELYGARSRPLRRIKKYGSFPNEIDVTSFFIKRMQQAREPFFASYLSFVPHGPYDDYGPEYRILPNVKKNFHRYINNLYILDKQLARIYKSLKDSGKLDRTIIVMVGDHGQAFWQHRFNFGHSRQSYVENYHAPLFFYQPKLFPPRQFDRLTSHVDILPTLLDAMQLPYNPNLLQGESLFRSKPSRKQIFLFGNEQTLSSMRDNGDKMQFSLKNRRCWVYQLQQDPQEKKRFSCKGQPDQWQALRRFLSVQRGLLHSYNKTRKAKQDFFGQSHPPVPTYK